MRQSSPLLIIALVVAALIHVSVGLQDLPTLARNGYLYDDSFYAFQIAKNIADGSGPSFDGIHLTNGFQPLYVFLLVPFYALSGGDLALPIHLALVMLALLSVATAYLLFLILRRYVSGGVAAFVALFWVLSPVVIRQTANGLETALATFMLSASVYYYLTRIRGADAPGVGRFVKLGLLLGLAVLSRLDQFFLALAMALDYLVFVRARTSPRTVLRNAGAALGSAFVVYSPWLVYGVVGVGRALPESGTATRFLSIAYAPIFGMGSDQLMTTGPDAGFIWHHVVRALTVLKLAPATHAFFRTVERLTDGTSMEPAAGLVVNVLGLLILIAFVAWVFARSRRPSGAPMRELGFLLLFSVSLIAAYSLYVFGVFFFIRYFYPVFFVATVFLAFVVEDVVALFRRAGAPIRVAAASVCAVYLCAHLVMAFNCCYRSRPVYHFYDMAQWVEENTDESDTIGVFQSGAIGYLSNRKVVNLDGKVNGDALEALKQGTLADYVHQSGIDVVMDNRRVLSLFLGPDNGEDEAHGLSKRLFTRLDNGVKGWIGYRLTAGADRSAGASTPAGGGSTPAPAQ